MRVAILHNAVADDAPADDRDVLDQVAAVRTALEAQGHRVTTLPVGLDLSELKARLASQQPERLFNLVEGLDGDDRGILHVPALLEHLGVPFTGAPLQAILMTTNKLVAKRLLRDAGLPTPAWYAAGDPASAADALAGERLIVKPVWDHGSRALDETDVRRFASGQALRDELERVRGSERFAESYVEGREFNLALLATADGDVEVLPPAEIVFSGWAKDRPRVVGYRAKWVESSFEYRNTPRCFDFGASDGPLLERLTRLALLTWNCFGLRGYARVDFRVDENGAPYILEANVNPCLTPDAGFAAALERAGIAYGAALERILSQAPRGAATVAPVDPTRHSRAAGSVPDDSRSVFRGP